MMEQDSSNAPSTPGPAPRDRSSAARWLRALALGLAAAAAAALLAAVILTLLFRQGHPQLAGQIVSALNEAIGSDSTRVVCDRVHGDLFHAAVVERPRLLVRRPDGERTWALARRLRVEYDLIDLFLRRNRTLRITVEGLEVSLVHDRGGNLVVPRFASGRPRRAGDALTRLDVAVHDGAVTLDRGGFRFGSIRSRAVVRLAPAGSTIDVRQLEGRSEMPGRPGVIRASGTASIEGKRLRLDPLRVALERTRISARLEWDLAHARVIGSTAQLQPLNLEEIMRLFDFGVATPGELRGTVAFVGDPVSGSGRCRLDGTIRGEPIDTLIARATLQPGAIRIDDVRIRVRRAELVGRALFETRGAMTGEFVVRDVNPALLPWWRMPERTPQGSLSGRVRLSARRGRPTPAAELHVAFAPSRLGRLRILEGLARLRHHPSGALHLDSLAVRVPGGEVTASGALAADSTVRLTVAATVRDLGAMDSLLTPLMGETGTGRVHGMLLGPVQRPEFRAEARLVGGRLANGLAFDTLNVAARGRLGGGGTGKADVHAAGLRAGARRLGELDAVLAIDRLVTLERFRLASADTVLTLHGVLRPVPHGAEMALDSLTLGLGGTRWTNAAPVGAQLRGEHLRIQRVALGWEAGRIELTGDLWLRRGAIDARGMLSNVELAPLFGGGDSIPRLAGRIGGEFTARGALADPQIEARLEVTGPRLRTLAGDSLRAILHYGPGRLEIDRLSWVAGGSRAVVRGALEPGFTLENWVHALDRGDRDWPRRVGLTLDVTADSLDLTSLATVAPALRTLSGFATLRARVGGTAAAPLLEIEARGSRLGYRGVGLEAAELEGSYGGQRLAIRRLELRQGGASSRIEGWVPLDLAYGATKRWLSDRPIQLAVRMPDADFSVASLFVPHIASSAGRLTLQADVGGTPREARISGTVGLTQGTVRFAGRAEVLQNVTVEGLFDAERLTVTRFSATEGKRGKLSGTGWWRWPGPGKPSDYEFQFRAIDCVTTDQENYEVRFTGSFTVRDARRPDGTSVPRVTGTATGSRGDLTLDLSKPPVEPPQPLPFLYDVTAHFPRNLWYLNLDAEMELGGPPLALANEGTGDRIRGSLEVLRGKYSYLYTDWRIVRGQIRFARLDRIDPEMDIVAVTHVQSPRGDRGLEPVYLSITGNASAPKLRLFDDRGSSPSYLFKVLSIGQFSSFGGEAVAGGASGSAAGPDLSLPIKNYLFRNAERLLSEARVIDTIDLRTGEATAGSTGPGAKGIGGLGVGKYVTPELYVRYSRDFASTLEQRIAAEYRVTRYLLLKGEQVQRSSGRQGRDQQYNLDLKVRLEY